MKLKNFYLCLLYDYNFTINFGLINEIVEYEKEEYVKYKNTCKKQTQLKYFVHLEYFW